MLTVVSGASHPLKLLPLPTRVRSFRPLALAVAAPLLFFPASAPAQTKLQRQLSYVDFGLQAAGQFTSTVSGPVQIPAFDQGTVVSQRASSTVGLLVTIRYAPRPYLGAEFNGGYARYTENYNVAPGQIQTQANELTVGYLVTPPYLIYGFRPYASAGGGIIRFAPTAGGGQAAPEIGEPGYYYNLGVQKDVYGNRLGVRAGFRQLFFTAPDFYQNYLTINKRTSTAEPVVGLYLRF